jgi:Family of unknown function (DUF5947)
MSADPLGVLRRVRESPLTTPKPQPGERCELCGETISEDHNHLVDLQARTLMCACRGCFLLFTPDGAGGNHFKAVPDRYLAFTDVHLTSSQWDALQIPVSVAFFFVNSTIDRVAAFYPSPAGATESLLSLDVWDDLVGANPELATLLPDVEAILVRTDRGTKEVEVYLVPIDACYELVGHLRRLWQGFDGGAEAHEALELFFFGVRDRAGL